MDSTEPSQFSIEVWSYSFTCIWRYSLPNVVSEYSNDRTFNISSRTLFPISSVKQLSVWCLQHWEGPRPCCCTLTFRTHICLKHWGVLLNVERGYCSIIGQWIVYFLGGWQPQYTLALTYGYRCNVHVLCKITVQIRCLYVARFSR